jgi:hypothetical protein
MIKPAAGYRPLAYSSPEAVQTTGTVVDESSVPAGIVIRQEALDRAPQTFFCDRDAEVLEGLPAQDVKRIACGCPQD